MGEGFSRVWCPGGPLGGARRAIACSWNPPILGTNTLHNPKYWTPFALEFLKTAKGEYRITEPGLYWFGDKRDREWLLVNEDFTTKPTNCNYAEVYGRELEARKPAERVWVPELEEWILVDPAMDRYETRALIGA